MEIGWNGGITKSPKETISLGKSLSNYIDIGDIISLNGELASGKTTFMKGVLSGLNYTHDVTSPTFTLVNEYNSSPKIIHIDCYRENNLKRWIGLGIHEYLDSNTIVFIEWAELIKPLLPENIIEIKFSHSGENIRKIVLNK
ncbi:MAG: tRNA (adenosine(37)-N6)-threonylcarbamoyltransferase complex ATPase subunit type 1 TsaE [Candidatus Marinimicrobia bacterium]|nr:tRNA (adenosine(37)-N6)-threonylcarbamoyltransferase complex ATPase subunit type 1 TsaE [Candidatus Neomarinimicrobiota bacterium]